VIKRAGAKKMGVNSATNFCTTTPQHLVYWQFKRAAVIGVEGQVIRTFGHSEGPVREADKDLDF
jgi:hypothetical protein